MAASMDKLSSEKNKNKHDKENLSDSESILITEIPEETLFHILSYLNFVDLVSVCQSCKKLRDAAYDELHWKKLCNIVWLENEPSEDLSWRQCFIKMHHKFGRYFSMYGEIKKAWSQIEKFYDNNFSEPIHRSMSESINAGLEEDAIDAVERKLKLKLPEDMRCSYRIHNGQNLRSPFGLMGSRNICEDKNLVYHGHYVTEFMLDLELAEELYPIHTDLTGCLSVTLCPVSRMGQFISIDEGSGIEPGNMFYPSVGSYMVQENFDAFVTANNFKDWLCAFGDDLENNRYPIVCGELFRFYKEPKCLAISGSIKVTVATSFMPHLSCVRPSKFVHAYQITMTMPEDVPEIESCKLDRRSWIITDENGVEERVEGPGVVGEYPVMKPGAKFSWISCTSFSTTYGYMTGHFTMHNLRTGAQVMVACPVFHMKAPVQITADDRKTQQELLKKNN